MQSLWPVRFLASLRVPSCDSRMTHSEVVSATIAQSRKRTFCSRGQVMTRVCVPVWLARVFSTSALLTSQSGEVFLVRAVETALLSGIPGPSWLDARASDINHRCLQTSPKAPGGRNHPWVRTTGLDTMCIRDDTGFYSDTCVAVTAYNCRNGFI